MDSLHALIAAQAPTVEDIDLPDETAFAPSAHPLDDEDRWVADVGESTDRAIFAEMVAGGPIA
jgi:hypothetical protein